MQTIPQRSEQTHQGSQASLPQPMQLAQGDHRWAQQKSAWRERQPAMPWPADLLEAFSLRMAGQGMSISRPLMLCDKHYALQQLADGQTMGDETLRLLSVQLFRHFESRQSGLAMFH